MNDQENVPVGAENMPEQEPTPTELPKNDHKKLLLIIVACVALLAVIVGGLFYMFKPAPPEPVAPPAPEVVYKTQECNYADDQAAYTEAVEKLDSFPCGCIQDEYRREGCLANVSDMLTLSNARKTYNLSLCENIVDETFKKLCTDELSENIAILEEENPEYLVQKWRESHNENAIGLYEKLLEEEPENISHLLYLALAYADKALKEQEKGNDRMPYVEKAFETIEKAKAVDSERSAVYNTEGYVKEIVPDLFGALASYEKAAELNPKNAYAYAAMGHVNRMLGALPLALEQYHKAAELDTNNEQLHIYVNICILEYTNGNSESAKESCHIVKDSNLPDNTFKSVAFQTLALIEVQNLDLERAESYMVSAIALDSSNANHHTTLANIKNLQKEFEEAQAIAEKAIEISPTASRAYTQLSIALTGQGRYEEAITAAEKGLELVDEDVSVLVTESSAVRRDLYEALSGTYSEMGDTEKQQEYQKLADEIFSNNEE